MMKDLIYTIPKEKHTKENIKAISLYKSLGFKIKEETETRYYMEYSNNPKNG